ncbi:MAG: hypothetical protein K2Q18_09140, partial [Bdellovibrionales bacterium]|nr:hypothetical protein [Bdellovibrionales bacterium]
MKLFILGLISLTSVSVFAEQSCTEISGVAYEHKVIISNDINLNERYEQSSFFSSEGKRPGTDYLTVKNDLITCEIVATMTNDKKIAKGSYILGLHECSNPINLSTLKDDGSDLSYDIQGLSNGQIARVT